MNHLFRAFQYRNYRLFFTGQGISLIGNWVTTTATAWLVYRLTDSEFLLGFVAFSTQIPAFLMAPFAGVMSDRLNRRRILLITQSLAMVQSLALAVLALSGVIAVWHIIALAIFQGLVNGFDLPTRQAFVSEIVERPEDLGNAIAMNSSMFNGARLIGPSIAGIIIARVGEGWCFLLDAVTYLAVIYCLWVMILTRKEPKPAGEKVFRGMKDGFDYAFGFAPLRNILLLVALISMMGMPYLVLLPVFARDVLHGGPKTLGFLSAFVGIGALCGAYFLASRRSVRGLGRVIVAAAITLGAGLIAMSCSQSLHLSYAMAMFTGFGGMVTMASSNTLLQTIADEDKRGRVLSFFTMAFMGAAPVGSLMMGAVAKAIGAPKAILIGGSFCIVGALIFARQIPQMRNLVRPIYVRKGIIPDEVARGLQSATHLTGPDEK